MRTSENTDTDTRGWKRRDKEEARIQVSIESVDRVHLLHARLNYFTTAVTTLSFIVANFTSSLYIIPNFVHAKLITHFGYRRTDGHPDMT